MLRSTKVCHLPTTQRKEIFAILAFHNARLQTDDSATAADRDRGGHPPDLQRSGGAAIELSPAISHAECRRAYSGVSCHTDALRVEVAYPDACHGRRAHAKSNVAKACAGV
jgi:hypothetical protein